MNFDNEWSFAQRRRWLVAKRGDKETDQIATTAEKTATKKGCYNNLHTLGESVATPFGSNHSGGFNLALAALAE